MAKITRRDRRIADLITKAAQGRKALFKDDIAKELMISPSEVESAIKRLKKAGLI